MKTLVLYDAVARLRVVCVCRVGSFDMKNEGELRMASTQRYEPALPASNFFFDSLTAFFEGIPDRKEAFPMEHA